MAKKIISTHSLTRRLTNSAAGTASGDTNFNSQPHKEADERMRLLGVWKDISTHSLTRRLTFSHPNMEINATIFQLTASQGG